MTKTTMNLSVLLSALAVSALSLGDAHAQDALVEGEGVKVSEGTVIRPIVGVETGYISNLYYQDTNFIQVAVLRIIGEVSAGSAGKARTKTEAPEGEEDQVSQGEAASLEWAAGVKLRYTEYPFASNPNIGVQRNLGADANLKIIVKPEGEFRFEFFDRFARDTNPTNFESRDQINREVNELKTGLIYQPGGRAITAGLHYKNRVDIFDAGNHSFANRVHHQAIVSAGWQWLPLTKFSFAASIGMFGPLGTSAWKQSSLPMRGRIGVASAFTEKTFGRASFGWAYTSYTNSMGDGAGYNTPLGDIELGYRYSPTGKFSIAYSYDFHDSINANYFRDHALLVKLNQRIDKIVFDGVLDARLRGYRGVPVQIMPSSTSREDFLIGARVRVRYLYREWLSFNAIWRTRVDETSFTYNTGNGSVNPSYTRHELLVGATAAF